MSEPRSPFEPDGDSAGKKSRERREFVRAISFFSQIGVTMCACVVIGVFLGKFLDGLFGTSPWLLLLFSLLGVAASFKSLYDMSMKK